MEKKNNLDEINLRRYRKNLTLSGQGYIAFSVWTCMKLFMIYTMRREDMQSLIDAVNVESYDEVAQTFVFVTVVVVLSLIALTSVLVHVGIGISAIKYSCGTKKKRGFLVAAGFFMILNIIGIPGYFINPKTGLDTIIASVSVDLTLAYILFDMIYCTGKIRKIQQSASEEEQ
ncbi:MAG: hypothetical protein IK078_02790 [Lachnospiraceae bacterium]|nr:hypothetical protein [Lachnospiraceae bacterium]MCR5338274.1 hypothetical protein [Lachnospiraceae bacterium]